MKSVRSPGKIRDLPDGRPPIDCPHRAPDDDEVYRKGYTLGTVWQCGNCGRSFRLYHFYQGSSCRPSALWKIESVWRRFWREWVR